MAILMCLAGVCDIVRILESFFGLGPRLWLDSKTAILVGIIDPALYGFLIASAKTRHGPVHLYLSGYLLSTFVVGSLYAVWSAQ